MLRKLFTMLALSSSIIIGAGNMYDIYPVPHKQVMAQDRASFTKSVNVVAEPSIDEATVNRAKHTDASPLIILIFYKCLALSKVPYVTVNTRD